MKAKTGTCARTKLPKSAAKKNRPPPLILPVAEWPEIDRQAWAEALLPAGRWQPKKHAHTITPTTIKNTRQSYGRALAVIAAHGQLDPNQHPAARITPAFIDLFVGELRAAGNADNTIKNRIFLIRTAMHMLAPGIDFDWLTRPGGISINAIFEDDICPLETIDPALVSNAAHQMILAAQHENKPADRLRLLRNGLLFGLLAGRAPRVGSIAKMKLGEQFTARRDGFWIAFAKTDMKNKRALSYSLPADLNEAMQWYLNEIRARAVSRDDHGCLWVCEDGSPFQYSGIGKMCRVESEKWLGIKMGPHRHRHNLATMMADEAPENPGAAATILGVSEGVVERHYERARERKAHEVNQAAIKKACDASTSAAERAFGVKFNW